MLDTNATCAEDLTRFADLMQWGLCIVIQLSVLSRRRVLLKVIVRPRKSRALPLVAKA